MSIYSRFYFRPGRGEQVRTVLQPEPEGAAVLCARALQPDGKPLVGALALLHLPQKDGAPELLACTVTDADGQFYFGPLEPERLYLVKLVQENRKLRELEIRTAPAAEP